MCYKTITLVGKEGFEPTQPIGDRFTVCCDSPTSPLALSNVAPASAAHLEWILPHPPWDLDRGEHRSPADPKDHRRYIILGFELLCLARFYLSC